MVDSTNLPNVDINQIATDLNNKMDRDCLNYSDTGYNFMAGAAMPSDTYIDLTLGASGTEYIAPANGWFYARSKSTAGNQYLQITANYLYGAQSWSNSTAQDLQITLPVTKNQKVIVFYNAGNDKVFRFIYAQGSESEAS